MTDIRHVRARQDAIERKNNLFPPCYALKKYAPFRRWPRVSYLKPKKKKRRTPANSPEYTLHSLDDGWHRLTGHMRLILSCKEKKFGCSAPSPPPTLFCPKGTFSKKEMDRKEERKISKSVVDLQINLTTLNIEISFLKKIERYFLTSKWKSEMLLWNALICLHTTLNMEK